MYEYKMITSNTFEITEEKYKSIFSGDETRALAKTNEMNENYRRVVLEGYKQKLEDKLEKMAEMTIYLTQKKYKLTDVTGTALVIRQEYQAWKIDNSSPTPTIDGWATDKGKTREEQLQSVGYVVTFLEKSSKIQELAYSKTDKATTKEQLATISSALDIVADCDSVPCVLQKADEVLEVLRGV